MKKLFTLLSLLLSLTIPVLAQSTGVVQVTGSHLQDSSNTLITNATISFQPVGTNGQPISFRRGGTLPGQAVTNAITAQVTGGAFTASLPDTSLTYPANVCYNVTVTDNVSGNQLLGSGYSCVQPVYDNEGSANPWCVVDVCNFDNYLPSTLPALSVNTVPNLSIGTVSTLSPGSSATATVTESTAGNGAPQFALNLGIPLGASNTLSMGTVTTGTPGSSAAASITGTSPSQTLNLTLPQGQAGPANILNIGSVTAGTTPAAAVVNSYPNQALNLTLPVDLMSIGTVTNGTAGGSASATITGSYPNRLLNLTLPTGATGPPTTFLGAWSSTTTYSTGQAVSYFNGTVTSTYVSLVNSNLNNIPSSSPSQWGVSTTGVAGTISGSVGAIQAANNSGTAPTSDSAITINTITHSLATKNNPVNVLHPDFALGSPIGSITLGGTLACTGTPTVTVSAPVYSGGTQAVMNVGCSNGTLYADLPANEGGGYNNTATVTISGGGTSGAIATVNLKGIPGPADPTGIACSDSAIQQAVDYSLGHPSSVGANVYPTVVIPGSINTYLICNPIDKMVLLWVKGEGESSTQLTRNGNFPIFVEIYSGNTYYQAANDGVYGGGITDMGLQGGGYTLTGSAPDTAAMVESDFPIGNTYRNLMISNAFGLGFHTDAQSERNHFESVYFGNVGWPALIEGNETILFDVDAQNPGQTVDGHCLGFNAPGFNCTNAVWAGGSIVGAATDGSGGAYTAINKPTSPIPAGDWVTVAGIPDITALNGEWQTTKILNGCSAPTSPYTSASTCATTNASDFVEIHSLTSGSAPTGYPFAYVPSADWAGVTVLNPTTATPTAGTSSFGSATWQATLVPQYNPCIELAGEDVWYMRGSIKSTQQCMGFLSKGVHANFGQLYVEGAIAAAKNPGGLSGYAQPYTTLTSTISGTTCTPAAPCTTTDTSHRFMDAQVYYPTNRFQTGFAVLMTVVCSDYNPSITTACAQHPSVNRNQFEKVLVTFSETSTTEWWSGRNQTGSTAPAGTAWTTNDIIGVNIAQLDTLQAPDLTYDVAHTNPMNISTSGYASFANDASAFVGFYLGVGTVPDGVVNFPPGATGQAAYPGSALVYDNVIAGNNAATCASNEAAGFACTKVIGKGNVSIYGSITNTSPTVETSANINQGWAINSTVQPVVFTSYGASNNSTGMLYDAVTGVRAQRALTTTTAFTSYEGNVMVNGGAFTTDQFFNQKNFSDVAGDIIAMKGDTNAFGFSLTPLGKPTLFSISSNSYGLGTTCTATASQQCPTIPRIWSYSFWNGTSATNGNLTEQDAFSPSTGTATTFTRSFSGLPSGLTNTLNLGAWSQVVLPAIKPSSLTLDAATASTVSNALTGSFTPTAVAAESCSDQTATITNMVGSDWPIWLKPPSSLGNVSAVVTGVGSGTATIHFCNPSAASVTPPSGTWAIVVIH